jgi:hypothetical protein
MYCCGCGRPLSAEVDPQLATATAETLAGAATAAGSLARTVAARQVETVVSKAEAGPVPSTDDSDPLLGTMVAGRFRVSSRLGAGGMGMVYLAEQVAVGRSVVLKFLHRRFSAKRDLTERFHREALAASRLSCPNTIVLHDFGQTEDALLYMAIEYLEGRTLGSVIATGPIAPLRAVPIALQILSSLAEAHRKGIVHRDLKPENIMLVERSGTSDFVKVLDFGIAKIVGLSSDATSPPAGPDGDPRDATPGASDPGLTQQGDIFGSPRYMAPEQVLGQAVDARTDLYALGLILYEMLVGHAPFEGTSTMEMLNLHLNASAPPLREVAPELALPEALEQLVQQCLRKKPDERPESAEALAEGLRALIPTIARQHEEQDRALLELVGVRRRWPRWVPYVAIGALLVAAAGGVLALRGGAPEEGTALAEGERLFVSASSPRVPPWVDATAPGAIVGRVRGADSQRAALIMAEGKALGQLLEIPARYDAERERELYGRDLRGLYYKLQGMTGGQLPRKDAFWAKLVVGEAKGKRRYVYDAAVRFEPLAPAARDALRPMIADLRYARYEFLLDSALVRLRCGEVTALMNKALDAIREMDVKREHRRRLRYLLQLKIQLGRCPK